MRTFQIPPAPDGLAHVDFRDEDAFDYKGWADLVTEGQFKGFWRDHHGGHSTWGELLYDRGPLSAPDDSAAIERAHVDAGEDKTPPAADRPADFGALVEAIQAEMRRLSITEIILGGKRTILDGITWADVDELHDQLRAACSAGEQVNAADAWFTRRGYSTIVPF